MSFLNVVIMETNYQMSAASNQEGGEGSDMDEPMASQGQVRVRFLEKIKLIDILIMFSISCSI